MVPIATTHDPFCQVDRMQRTAEGSSDIRLLRLQERLLWLLMLFVLDIPLRPLEESTLNLIGYTQPRHDVHVRDTSVIACCHKRQSSALNAVLNRIALHALDAP